MKNTLKNIAYSILDFLTFYKGVKRTINGYTIRFPAKWSRFYSDGYEKETFDFFKKNIKQGDTVLDIGAHIGLYTAPFSLLAGKNGKVFSFEPTPSTFSILKKTISLNNFLNVTPVNAAISDKNGEVQFNLTTSNGEASNANSLVEINRTKSSINVKAYSIDNFRKENGLRITILKIDVEGAELLALKGAINTFEQDKPSGILALHPANIIEFGHTLEQIWDCMHSYGLNVTYRQKPISKTEFCGIAHLFDVEFKPGI